MKRVIIIRYGGFGDVVQAASILPGLKNDGWHITWDTSEQGFELLKSDPLVDALLLTPVGSVPDESLGPYWESRTNGFHRVINLCESVENASLMKPNVLGFYRDDETRRRLYGNINYVEHIHAIAGVSGPFLPRYCPEIEEIEAANRVLGQKNVVLALAGSSEYKVWPRAPTFVERILLETSAKIFLVGGEKDVHLAQQIVDSVAEEHPSERNRVVNLTNRPIRDVFAVAWQSDVIVGPGDGHHERDGRVWRAEDRAAVTLVASKLDRALEEHGCDRASGRLPPVSSTAPNDEVLPQRSIRWVRRVRRIHFTRRRDGGSHRRHQRKMTMSNIRAKVTKEFDGVEDGKVHPRRIEVGEEIFGSLAETAIGMKHAKETSDSKADRSAEAELEDNEARIKREEEEAAAARAAKVNSDIEKLKLLPHDQLVGLATTYQIDIADAPADPEIIVLLQAGLEAVNAEIPAPAAATDDDKGSK